MLKKSDAQPERKTVLVRESHQLLRVPPCVMRQAGGRLHRTHLAQHKGDRERMVEPAGFRQGLVDARASLIDVAQKRQCQRQVTQARRVRIGHRYGGANRASGRISQTITQLEKGARCHKLPAKVATGAVDIVTQQQSGLIFSCLAQSLHLLGKGHRQLVLGPNHMETPLEIEQRSETILSIEPLSERSRPDEGVGHHRRRIPTSGSSQ